MTATAPETARYSRWEKATRYYVLQLEQDLFGDWVLTRVWGRKGTALGQLRREFVVSHAEGLARLQKEETRRLFRFYMPLTVYSFRDIIRA